MNRLIAITPEHPFYSELMENLDLKPAVDVAPQLDYKAMMRDYNKLPIGGFLGFLYYGKTEPLKRLDHSLKRRGLRVGKAPSDDVSVFVLPVLSMEATALVATAPNEELPPSAYDGQTAVDSVIARRASCALNSESLPLIENMWQVYLYRKTPTEAKVEVKGRGRPKKNP